VHSFSSHIGNYLLTDITYAAIAAAAGFEAMKAYEDHLRTSGEEPSHPLMKELLAAFAAAEIDRLVETKGASHAPFCTRSR
jgi:hypothetical protein